MLSRVKMSFKDLRLAILGVNETVISEQFLKQLQSHIPTNEEQAQLAEHESDVESLGTAEQFYCEMMKISRYEQRLNAMLFKRKFNERAQEIRPIFESLLMAVQQVRSSQNLQRVLAVR
jgi:hypothetical protein